MKLTVSRGPFKPARMKTVKERQRDTTKQIQAAMKSPRQPRPLKPVKFR